MQWTTLIPEKTSTNWNYTFPHDIPFCINMYSIITSPFPNSTLVLIENNNRYSHEWDYSLVSHLKLTNLISPFKNHLPWELYIHKCYFICDSDEPITIRVLWDNNLTYTYMPKWYQIYTEKYINNTWTKSIFVVPSSNNIEWKIDDVIYSSDHPSVRCKSISSNCLHFYSNERFTLSCSSLFTAHIFRVLRRREGDDSGSGSDVEA